MPWFVRKDPAEVVGSLAGSALLNANVNEKHLPSCSPYIYDSMGEMVIISHSEVRENIDAGYTVYIDGIIYPKSMIE